MGSTALTLDADNVEAMASLGNISGSQFRFDEAESIYKKVIDLNH